jgi:c(7)-type cytochrome triheme protein
MAAGHRGFRPPGRRDGKGLLPAALALLALGACARAAGILFDLPPNPAPASPPAAQTPGSGGSGPAPVDSTRPAIEATLDPDSVLARLPKHANGEVDWNAALEQGVIRPRGTAPGLSPPAYLEGFGYDFVFQGPQADFDARFPHSAHTRWLACTSCHGSLIRYRGTPITMDQIGKGESCGTCHGTVAFSREACGRCHPGMPPGEFSAQLSDDIVLARAADSTGMAATLPPSRFAHWVHRIRYRCSACHDALFPMRAGADTLKMDSLAAGRACGTCHNGTQAFGLLECIRCHAAPRRPEGGW